MLQKLIEPEEHTLPLCVTATEGAGKPSPGLGQALPFLGDQQDRVLLHSRFKK